MICNAPGCEEGQVEGPRECYKPMSECCGGCYTYEDCEECNGTGSLEPSDYDQYARKCSKCESGMSEGYCINAGEDYYCSETCLEEQFTADEIKDMCIGEDNSDSYWTEWEDEEDYQYAEVNGELILIEE